MTDLHVGLDLDGTLVDSRSRHGRALAAAEVSLECELPHGLIANYVALKSDGRSGLKVLKASGIPDADKLIARWAEIIESDEFLLQDALYRGVTGELKKHAARGMVFYIVTSRQRRGAVLRQIEELGLGKVIEHTYVVQPGGSATKGRASEHLELCAVVGDTEVDWEWSRELTVDFFPLDWGFRNRAFWLERGVKPWKDLGAVLDAIEKKHAGLQRM